MWVRGCGSAWQTPGGLPPPLPRNTYLQVLSAGRHGPVFLLQGGGGEGSRVRAAFTEPHILFTLPAQARGPAQGVAGPGKP